MVLQTFHQVGQDVTTGNFILLKDYRLHIALYSCSKVMRLKLEKQKLLIFG